MDPRRFDALVQTLAQVRAGSRRTALGALLASTLGLLGPPETAATRRKRRKRQQRRARADRHRQGAAGERRKGKKKCAALGAPVTRKRKKCCVGLVLDTAGRCTAPLPATPPGPPPAPAAPPPPPPSGGDDSCFPGACALAGLNCGTNPFICGGRISCGTCTPPQTCGGGGTPNVCGCTPRACPVGLNCGTIDDGCGGQVRCGPDVCQHSGTICQQTVCQSNVCTTQNLPPGRPCDDGDPCTTGETCQNGICTGGRTICTSPPECRTAAGATCNAGVCTYPPLAAGTACSAEPCGACNGAGACVGCTPPQTCGGGGNPNVCGCTPITTCPPGTDCGTIDDGCGGRVRCGPDACAPPADPCQRATCQANVCTTSSTCGGSQPICIAGRCLSCQTLCGGRADCAFVQIVGGIIVSRCVTAVRGGSCATCTDGTLCGARIPCVVGLFDRNNTNILGNFCPLPPAGQGVCLDLQ